MAPTPALTAEEAYAVVARVPDPELPVLTIAELGILRDVRVLPVATPAPAVEVDITPTYSGCPALEAIRSDVKDALRGVGVENVRVRTVLAPAWTTDWITADGRRKLAESGVAPPGPAGAPRGPDRSAGPVPLELSVRCPRCGSLGTREVSRFGPTPCTALRTCGSCLEPFEAVKPLSTGPASSPASSPANTAGGAAASVPADGATVAAAVADRTVRHAVFHPLRVGLVEELTEDAVAVTFDVPPDLADDYAFVPGQHVTVRTPAAGDDLRRNYSICSPASGAVPLAAGSRSTTPGNLRIGIKRVAHGGFSSYALERMRPGDLVDVMTPTGRFCVATDPHNARHLCLVAAGSGITPILSMAASVLADEPDSSVTLLYGNRTTKSIMFVDELADLKDRWPDRLQLVHVLSRETPDIALLGGRIDGPKLRDFLDKVVPPSTVDGWYLCGPLAMVEELRRVLRSHDVPRQRVHTELFHVGPPPTTAPVPADAPEVGEGGACEVTALMDGRRSSFSLARVGPPVLEGVLGVRSDAPFACRGGVCGTCRAKVLEGSVTMDHCYALEPEEIARGYVLTCQAHPTSERLVVDYDA